VASVDDSTASELTWPEEGAKHLGRYETLNRGAGALSFEEEATRDTRGGGGGDRRVERIPGNSAKDGRPAEQQPCPYPAAAVVAIVLLLGFACLSAGRKE